MKRPRPARARRPGMTALQAVVMIGAAFVVVWGFMEAWRGARDPLTETTEKTLRGEIGTPRAGSGGSAAAAGPRAQPAPGPSAGTAPPVETTKPRAPGGSDTPGLPRPTPTPKPQPAPTPTPPAVTKPTTPEDAATAAATTRFQEVRPLLDVTKTVSDLAYQLPPKGTVKDGLTVVGGGEDPDTGFRYVVVRGPDGKVYLGFAGTDFDTWHDTRDLGTDVEQAAGFVPAQYQQALDVARIYQAQFGDRLVVTGHSLGGGQATYVAAMLGVRGVGFNSAPLGPGTLADIEANGVDHPERLITQVNNEHDPVSQYTPGLNYLYYLPTFGAELAQLTPNGAIPKQLGEEFILRDQGGLTLDNHSLGNMDLDQAFGYRPPQPLPRSMIGTVSDLFGIGSK